MNTKSIEMNHIEAFKHFEAELLPSLNLHWKRTPRDYGRYKEAARRVADGSVTVGHVQSVLEHFAPGKYILKEVFVFNG